MEISTYKPQKTPSLELIELLRKQYGASKNFDYFMSDVQKAFAFCVDNDNITFVPIAACAERDMQGHIALIIDKRRPTEEAFFGFLVTPHDPHVFQSLWDILVTEAKARGRSILKGPVNGSIWHQYRCIKETDGSPFFKTELFSNTSDYDLLNTRGPVSEIRYHSGYRERFDAILHIGQPAYDRLAAEGFRIKEMTSGSMEELQTIAVLSRTVFNQSWGFVELNQKEFFDLYSSEKLSPERTKIYLLYNGEQIIGFCGTTKEDDTTVICKTIALLPEYQGRGLGKALAYKVHLDAKKQGVKKIIYALIREDNAIKNFPKEDAVIFRRYATFEFQI